MSNKILVQRSQIIDIALAAGFSANSINIPDQPMLRNKRITGIEVFTKADMPISPITGNPVTTIAQLNQSFITMYIADPVAENDTGEYIYRFPLVSMHNQQSSAGDDFVQRTVELDSLMVQWEKCSINFATPLVPGNAISIVINVFYTSRHHRVPNLLNKKISGLNEGSLIEMLIAKLMALEQRLLNNEEKTKK